MSRLILNKITVYVIIIMEIVLAKVGAHNFSSCTALLCENDSLCKTIVYLSSGEERAQAQCVCHGGFTGPRCEAVMRLFASEINSRSVKIGIMFEQTHNGSMAPENVLEDFLMYSLHYWNNKTSKSCSVIPQSSLRNHIISGLQPETEYTFCANSDSYINWCPVEDTSDCLVLKTRDLMAGEPFPPYLVPVTIIVVILITVFIVSVLALKKKHFICVKSKDRRLFLESESLKSRRRRQKKKDRHNHDLFLLPGTPPSERLQINTPSSPGRPKHSLSKQSRGYASFSAKNDKAIALKTVLEYVPIDDNEQTEPCLIIHDTSST